MAGNSTDWARLSLVVGEVTAAAGDTSVLRHEVLSLVAASATMWRAAANLVGEPEQERCFATSQTSLLTLRCGVDNWKLLTSAATKLAASSAADSRAAGLASSDSSNDRNASWLTSLTSLFLLTMAVILSILSEGGGLLILSSRRLRVLLRRGRLSGRWLEMILVRPKVGNSVTNSSSNVLEMLDEEAAVAVTCEKSILASLFKSLATLLVLIFTLLFVLLLIFLNLPFTLDGKGDLSLGSLLTLPMHYLFQSFYCTGVRF